MFEREVHDLKCCVECIKTEKNDLAGFLFNTEEAIDGNKRIIEDIQEKLIVNERSLVENKKKSQNELDMYSTEKEKLCQDKLGKTETMKNDLNKYKAETDAVLQLETAEFQKDIGKINQDIQKAMDNAADCESEVSNLKNELQKLTEDCTTLNNDITNIENKLLLNKISTPPIPSANNTNYALPKPKKLVQRDLDEFSNSSFEDGYVYTNAGKTIVKVGDKRKEIHK